MHMNECDRSPSELCFPLGLLESRVLATLLEFSGQSVSLQDFISADSRINERNIGPLLYEIRKKLKKIGFNPEIIGMQEVEYQVIIDQSIIQLDGVDLGSDLLNAFIKTLIYIFRNLDSRVSLGTVAKTFNQRRSILKKDFSEIDEQGARRLFKKLSDQLKALSLLKPSFVFDEELVRCQTITFWQISSDISKFELTNTGAAEASIFQMSLPDPKNRANKILAELRMPNVAHALLKVLLEESERVGPTFWMPADRVMEGVGSIDVFDPRIDKEQSFGLEGRVKLLNRLIGGFLAEHEGEPISIIKISPGHYLPDCDITYTGVYPKLMAHVSMHGQDSVFECSGLAAAILFTMQKTMRPLSLGIITKELNDMLPPSLHVDLDEVSKARRAITMAYREAKKTRQAVNFFHEQRGIEVRLTLLRSLDAKLLTVQARRGSLAVLKR